MCLLFFVGIFASFLLVRHREGRKFPWGKIIGWGAVALVALAGVFYLLLARFGYHIIRHWPFMAK